MTRVVSSTADAAERIVAGVLLALLANAMFATSDVFVKLLTARYSVFQVIVMQASFALLPVALIVARDGGPRRMRVRNPGLVALRGGLAGFGTVFGFFAFSQLPLADVYAIAFCIPLMVTLLSIPILGEPVGWHRWGAVLVGFAGVLVMVRPGFAELTLGHLAATISVVTGAGVVLIIRRIAREEQRAVMVTAVMAGLLLGSLPGMLLTFRVPSWRDLGLAATGGLVMGSAQFLVVRALSLSPAAVVAPMQYTMMIWAVLYGLVVFADPVSVPVMIGAALVVASSLYTMHRERRRGRTLRAHVDEV